MTHKNRFCCSYVTLRSHKKLQCTHISYGKLKNYYLYFANYATYPDFMKYKKSISWSKFQRFGSGHFCNILTRRNDLNRLRIEPCINHSCMIKTRFCDFLTKVAVFLLTMEFLKNREKLFKFLANRCEFQFWIKTLLILVYPSKLSSQSNKPNKWTISNRLDILK